MTQMDPLDITLSSDELQQIDPRKVWLHLTDDGQRLYLTARKTGAVVPCTYYPLGGLLPYPIVPMRREAPDAPLYFHVPEHHGGTEAALARASEFGFRTDAEDVAMRGDPGYCPLEPVDTPLFAAAYWRGRKTDTPSTIVRLIEESRDRNGFARYDYLEPDTALDAAPLEEVDEDLFVTDLSVDEVSAALRAAGLTARPYFKACYEPADLYFQVSRRGDLISVRPREGFSCDDDLRDGSLAVIPDVFGDNACECTWEAASGYSVEDIHKAMIDAGFAPDPDPDDME